MEGRDALSLIFTASADPTRRAIFSRLAKAPSIAGEVGNPTSIRLRTISKE